MYRFFFELMVNIVFLNLKVVICIGLGFGCWGVWSVNNRLNI